MAATGSAIHDKRNPFPATIIDNLPIVGRGSTKETRHVEISLAGSGLHYEPGDALGIAATNGSGVVSALPEALQLAPEATLEIKGEATTLGQALTSRFRAEEQTSEL